MKNKEYEWFTATYNTDTSKFENKDNNGIVKFKVHMIGEIFEDTIFDAAVDEVNKRYTIEEYPNLEIISIEDEDGNRIISEDNKDMIKFLSDNGIKYRAFKSARYQLTPEALLLTVLDEHNIKVDFDEVKQIFSDFMGEMVKNGYAEKKKDSEE